MKKIEKIAKRVQEVNGWEHIAEMACMFSVDAYGVSNEDWNRAALRVAHFVLTKWQKTEQGYGDTYEFDRELQVAILFKDIEQISEIVESQIPDFEFKEDILSRAEIERKLSLEHIHEVYIRLFETLKLSEIAEMLGGLELNDYDLEELQKEAEY